MRILTISTNARIILTAITSLCIIVGVTILSGKKSYHITKLCSHRDSFIIDYDKKIVVYDDGKIADQQFPLEKCSPDLDILDCSIGFFPFSETLNLRNANLASASVYKNSAGVLGVLDSGQGTELSRVLIQLSSHGEISEVRFLDHDEKMRYTPCVW